MFDGHGGSEAAVFCERHLGEELKSCPEYNMQDFDNAFIKTFIKMDEMLGSPAGKRELTEINKDADVKQSPLMQILRGENPGDPSGPEELQLDAKGCTANVCLVRDGVLYCANAGDSRAVLCRGGVAEEMSHDHKPEDKTERDRIYKAGSTVTEGRVDGNLNLSRSIGDLKHKQVASLPPAEQPITCVPDVKTRTLSPDDEFLVIACDGIWEQKSSQDIVDFVRARIDGASALSAIIEELFEDIVSPDYTKTSKPYPQTASAATT